MLHDWYRLNALDVRSAPEWERRWLSYIAQGYTLDDLAVLVRYLKREIKQGRRNAGALLLRNLLDLGPDSTFLRLDEDLALARAAYPAAPVRPPVTIPKAAAPQATQAQLSDWARQMREGRERIARGMRPDLGDTPIAHRP
jgi:hypothetical protein